MHAHFSKTFCDPAIEQTFMESYYARAAEHHQEWADRFVEMATAGRKLGIDCHAAFRELRRRMKRDLSSAEQAMQILAHAEPKSWGQGQYVLEVAWESLERHFALWSKYAQR